MDQYFKTVLESLSNEDVSMLKLLNEQQANAKFKAIKKKYVYQMCGLTEATFRKVIYRLEAIQFIELVYGGKEHKLVLTPFGEQALGQIKLDNSLY